MSVHRHLLEVSTRASAHAVLAVVVETEGSTYVRRGAMALFGDDDLQLGWLSGGCLEPEISARARIAGAAGHLDWMDIDTRDDEALLSGSAVGCRGRLHLALLPLSRLPEWSSFVRIWSDGREPLRLSIEAKGELAIRIGEKAVRAALKVAPTAALPRQARYRIDIPPLPTVMVLGAGPETPYLLSWLHQLGWRVTLAERRPRWRGQEGAADIALDRTPSEAMSSARDGDFDAALVMHHHFELDREALAALAESAIPFIGLLGPVRRRDDLFKVLPAQACERLRPRLRSPIGLKLGGQGPEAIALSIVAQLHAYQTGEQS